MQGLFSRVVPIWTLLTLLNSTKVNYGQSESIKQNKGSEEGNPFEISYISKPSVSSIDVVCHAYLASTFQITCPVFDGKELEYNLIASKADTCESTVEYFRAEECIRLVRRISWKQIGTDFYNFTCSCGKKLQAANNSKNLVSVKITNQKCERNIKVFRRKINAEKNIHISCCITGQPAPQITWYKNEFALNITHGSAVIDNVRYQQKGARLLISRTDVHGSGRYQCLAGNSAGHERGGTYQIIFYESKTNKSSDELKRHNVITSTPLAVAITHVKTTKMAKIYPSVGISPTHTPREPEGNFLRNANETTDNKEEEEKHEKQNKRKEFPVTAILTVALAIILVSLLCFVYRRKKAISTDRIAERSVPATSLFGRCTLLPVILCGDQDRKSKKTQLTDDGIEEKLVEIDYELCPLPLDSSPNRFLSYLSTTSVFHPCPETTTNTFSTDVAVETHLVPRNGLEPLVSMMPCSSSIEDIHHILHHMTETDSNTSELIDKLFTVPPNADERYFENKLIDHNGGEVILAGTGIKLVIPEGAIDEGKTEVVHLALLGNPEYAPKELKNDDTSLTPVVMCGPHGLRFKKYVMLVLPHCVAVSDELKGNFRVLCSDTAPEIAPKWTEIFDNNDEPNNEVFCDMGDQQFCLFLRHFSWYTITGTDILARDFNIAAYQTTLHQPNEEFKVRIYIIPILQNSYVGQKRVDETEEKLQGTLSDAPKIKIFYQNGGDIKIEATQISEGWELIDQNIQREDYNVLYSCLEGTPNRTFRFQHVSPRPEKISAKFTVFQENCEFDTPTDICMSVHFESEIKRAQFRSPNNNDSIDSGRHASIPSSSGFFESGESTTSVAFIPTKLREDLIQLLDINMVGTENWEDLAGHLGCSLQFIRWLKYTDGLRRTETLLMKWENDVNENPEDALASLQQILLKMKRMDAAAKIQIYLTKHPIRKETVV